MQQSIWQRGLGIGLLVIAMAGCEDPPLPTSVPVAGASASPGPSASPTGSPRPTTSPTATPTATPTPTPVPTRTPIGATPTPTPTPTATASSSIAAAPTAVVFTAPLPNANFTANSVTVRVDVEVPSGVTLQKITLQYDGRDLVVQKGSSLSLNYQWNPNVLPMPEGNEPVAAGSHKLTAIATTTAGTTKSTDLVFDKPFAFNGWTNVTDDDKAIPALPEPRGAVRLVADDTANQLYALFGIDSDGQDMVGIARLSIDNIGQPGSIGQWVACAPSGLAPRRYPAVAAAGTNIYIAGGKLAGASSALAPTSAVYYYKGRDEVAVTAPSLPVPLSEAQAAVLAGYLYVTGGTTDDTAAGTSTALYRLKLSDVGEPAVGANWETRATVEGRRGGALVAHAGKLYLLGGKNANDVYARVIHIYNPPEASGGESWKDLGMSLTDGLYHPSAVSVGGSLVVTGGRLVTDNQKLAAVVQIDPVARTKKTLDPGVHLPSARAEMGAAVIDGEVWIAGGFETETDSDSDFAEIPLSSVLRSNSL